MEWGYSCSETNTVPHAVTSSDSLCTSVLSNSVFPSGKQAWRGYYLPVLNLWQGDRGEAGPPGRGERGDPGAPGPKVSYSYVGGELSLAWECTPLAIEYATNSSTDAKTTQIISTSLKCTPMASDSAVQLFLFTLCSSVKKFNSISERKGRVVVI